MDDLDKKILWELLKDGRKSFTAIAKTNNVSEDTIWKRYKEMEKKGIITGATIQFNYKLFGYHAVGNVRLNIDSQNINPVLESLQNWELIGEGVKVLDSLNNWPQTGQGAKGVTRLYGSQYTVNIFVIFKTLRDLETAKEIITRQNHQINGFDTNVWVDTRAIPENILHFSPQPAEQDVVTSKEPKPQEEVKIDEWDLQIVEKLSVDGRMPFGKIAKAMGVSTDTVTRRYERLKKNNLLRTVLQIDPAKLGYQGFLVILLEISIKGYINKTVEELSKIPGVHDIIRVSGSFDLEIVAHIEDCNSILTLNKEIAKIPYVKKVETSFAEVYHSWPPRRTPITTF